jgi:hypothetical protein
MLTFDHMPFYGQRLRQLRDVFTRLGFFVSPPGRYTSPDLEDRFWLAHCVFFEANWLDLIAIERTSTAAVLPGAVLLRTESLDATTKQLGELCVGSRYRLERRWDDDTTLPRETFELVSLSWKAGPLRTSVIQHDYPCRDTKPEWYQHPNSAQGIVRLTVRGRPAIPPALQNAADLNWLTLKPDASRVEIAVRVRSLNEASRVMSRYRTRFERTDNAIQILNSPDFDCVWTFVE